MKNLVDYIKWNFLFELSFFFLIYKISIQNLKIIEFNFIQNNDLLISNHILINQVIMYKSLMCWT